MLSDNLICDDINLYALNKNCAVIYVTCFPFKKTIQQCCEISIQNYFYGIVNLHNKLCLPCVRVTGPHTPILLHPYLDKNRPSNVTS